MIYEYQCTNPDCAVVSEKIQSLSDPLLDSIVCPICGAEAKFKISVPAVLTSGMGNQTFDVAVGRDAERRWAEINRRQEARDKVRRESGKAGIHASSFDQFEPISEKQRQIRTEAHDQ